MRRSLTDRGISMRGSTYALASSSDGTGVDASERFVSAGQGMRGTSVSAAGKGSVASIAEHSPIRSTARGKKWAALSDTLKTKMEMPHILPRAVLQYIFYDNGNIANV
jgi:hypothetical protein